MASLNIGFLLPRSTDYPGIAFDLLDGLRLNLKQLNITDVQIFTENIGFGEDSALNHSKAEKMIIENNVQLIIAYSSNFNAELLYDLATTSGCPFLFLDPMMDTTEVAPNPLCHFISLQGLLSCSLAGKAAASVGKNVLNATSFYDGGYRGPWSMVTALNEGGGEIRANFVSAYRTDEFSIQQYMDTLKQMQLDVVLASFSSYLAELLFAAFKKEGNEAVSLPFFCSPFMLEEQLLSKVEFPGGNFQAFVPWITSLDNKQNSLMMETLKNEKNKTATIFHLLGWEAAIVVNRLFGPEKGKLAGYTYESPRGTVSFHPDSNLTYAPLYKVQMKASDNGKSTVELLETVAIDAKAHFENYMHRPTGQISRWKNNFLCI